MAERTDPKAPCKKITIDLYPKFLDENNHLRADLTKDGLHLNADGYQVWVQKSWGMVVICRS